MTPAPSSHDQSTRGIVVSNILTIAAALWQDWPLALMLWPYWAQSVVIGWYARKRILALETFSTEGFTSNGRAVDPTPETKRSTANFFAMHYGFFHLGYLVFLVDATAKLEAGGAIGALDWLIVAALTVGFALSQRAAFPAYVAADRRRVPNIGSMMFAPYLRVLPMHFTILFGSTIGQGGVLVFGALKTLADVAMHAVERAWLRKAGVAAVRS